MLRTVGLALRSPSSALAGLGAALAVFLLIVWLPNLGLIWSVVTSGTMSIADKAGFLWDSLGAIRTSFTSLGAALTVAVAALFGLNVAVALHHVRERAAEARAGGTGLGVALALVGAGCSSCGAVVLSTLLGAGATSSFAATLPLHGDELSLLSAVVLAATLALTVRSTSRAGSCAIDPPPAGGTDRSRAGSTG